MNKVLSISQKQHEELIKAIRAVGLEIEIKDDKEDKEK